MGRALLKRCYIMFLNDHCEDTLSHHKVELVAIFQLNIFICLQLIEYFVRHEQKMEPPINYHKIFLFNIVQEAYFMHVGTITMMSFSRILERVHVLQKKCRITINKIQWIATMAFQVDTSFPIMNDCLKFATKELLFLGCFKTTTSNPSSPLSKNLPNNK
jgi:hypothetical protein